MGTRSKKTRATLKRAVAEGPVKEPTERFRLNLAESLAARIDALVPQFSSTGRRRVPR